MGLSYCLPESSRGIAFRTKERFSPSLLTVGGGGYGCEEAVPVKCPLLLVAHKYHQFNQGLKGENPAGHVCGDTTSLLIF